MSERDQVVCEETKVTLVPSTGRIIGKQRNVFLAQLWAFSGCFFITVLSGTVSGYSAILLPQLEHPNSTIRATINQQSWIASMAPLPMSLGCLVSGWSMDQFGRKRTLNAATVIFFLGWMLIYFSKTIETLLVGRLVTGFCVGYSGPAGSCYIGEVSSPKYRGAFLAGICLGVASGLLVTHILGTIFDWRTVALIICAGPIFVIFIAGPVPESHVWLQSKGRFTEAQEALEWYSDTKQCVQNRQNQLSHGVHSNSYQNSERTTWQKRFLCKEFLKPVMVMNLFFVTAQLSGNNAVVFYSVTVMQSTVPSLNKYAAMIIVDAIRVIMSVVACLLTRKFKTRVLTFISAVGTVVSLYSLAFFAHLTTVYPESVTFSTVPLVFLVSYIVFISVGIVPLPWSLSGELLPANEKGVGGGIATAVNFLAFFLVVKTSPEMFAQLGTAVSFGTYGTLTLLCSIILYFVLPETKNKTLEEIQGGFK